MTRATDETFATCRQQLSTSRLETCAESMGATLDGDALLIPFFNRTWRVAPSAMEDAQGNKPTEAVGLVLCKYILQHPSVPPPHGRRITFRELSGAGPLVSSFTRNTNKLIASAFATDMKTLAARSKELNGECHINQNGFDVSVRFPALPGIPLFLQLNTADDLFPAQCNLLFYQSAEQYLDMKSLFILGTYLAGNLVSEIRAQP